MDEIYKSGAEPFMDDLQHAGYEITDVQDDQVSCGIKTRRNREEGACCHVKFVHLAGRNAASRSRLVMPCRQKIPTIFIASKEFWRKETRFI